MWPPRVREPGRVVPGQLGASPTPPGDAARRPPRRPPPPLPVRGRPAEEGGGGTGAPTAGWTLRRSAGVRVKKAGAPWHRRGPLPREAGAAGRASGPGVLRAAGASERQPGCAPPRQRRAQPQRRRGGAPSAAGGHRSRRPQARPLSSMPEMLQSNGTRARLRLADLTVPHALPVDRGAWIPATARSVQPALNAVARWGREDVCVAPTANLVRFSRWGQGDGFVNQHDRDIVSNGVTIALIFSD